MRARPGGGGGSDKRKRDRERERRAAATGRGVATARSRGTGGGRRRDDIPRTPRRRREGWKGYRRAPSGGLPPDDGDGGGDRAWPTNGRRTTARAEAGRSRRTD